MTFWKYEVAADGTGVFKEEGSEGEAQIRGCSISAVTPNRLFTLDFEGHLAFVFKRFDSTFF